MLEDVSQVRGDFATDQKKKGNQLIFVTQQFFKDMEQYLPNGRNEGTWYLMFLTVAVDIELKDILQNITNEFGDTFKNVVPKKIKNDELQQDMFPKHISKSWMPIVDNDLKPSLFGLNDDLLMDDVKNFVKTVENGYYVDVLAQIPGEGKTCKLLAVGTKMFLILITCTDTTIAIRSKIFTDESFQELKRNLDNLEPFDAIRDVSREVNIYFFARLLHFMICYEQRKDLTPMDYILLQLNGMTSYVKMLYQYLRSMLNECSNAKIQQLVIDMAKYASNRAEKLAFCIDELNVTSQDKEIPRYVEVLITTSNICQIYLTVWKEMCSDGYTSGMWSTYQYIHEVHGIFRHQTFSHYS